MKCIFQIIFLLFLLVSCEKSKEPLGSNTGQNNGKNIKQEAIIDDSDLSYLPVDTGGVHKAYPLGESNAEFGHYVYTPGGYENDGPEYPLIIFLHGWGERGDSGVDDKILERILSHGPPKLIKLGQWDPKYPFIVVSPQLVSEYWPTEKVHSFIEYLIENYQINTNRIYLTGLSLGGGGSWYYVGEIENNYAAAIVPICGSGNEYLVNNLRKVPIWAFHGAKDVTIALKESEKMVNAVNDAGGNAKLTIYPESGHDCWTETYNNEEVFKWLLSHRKGSDN